MTSIYKLQCPYLTSKWGQIQMQKSGSNKNTTASIPLLLLVYYCHLNCKKSVIEPSRRFSKIGNPFKTQLINHGELEEVKYA